MATYEQLVGSSFTDVVVPFRSDNSLGSIDTCTTLLTGYTLPDTEFTFTAELSALENTYIGASMDKLIWDMGDGTYHTGVSVTKHYPYPGEYDVTTIFTDQNGVTHKNRLTQKIRVMNYIPDSLVWYTPTIADPFGGQPERVVCGSPSNDLSIYRMNSWQSWHMVSGDGGYFINLYATGSKSRPLTKKQYGSNPDTHFIPSWRFIQGKESRKPIERVQTANEFIYVKREGTDLVRASSEDSTAIFAGTSGHTTVNYIDDNPNRLTSARSTQLSNNVAAATQANTNISEEEAVLANLGSEDRDIILYASFDTSKFPVVPGDTEIAKFELMKSNYFQVYETQKVGLPMQVKFNNPRQLSITSTGIHEPGFFLTGKKFFNSPQPLAVRTMDLSGNTINTDEIVPLSSRWYAPTESFSGGDITTDVLTAQGFVTMYLSGNDSTFEQIKSPYKSDEDFKVWDIGSIVAKNESNKQVRVWLADRKTLEPLTFVVDETPRNKMVSVLYSEIVPEQQETLKTTTLSDHLYPHGRPRDWTTRSGEQYFGYLTTTSNFDDTQSINMQLEPADTTFETPGSWLTFANLEQPDLKYNYDKTKYRFYAHTLIKPPETFTYDVAYYYITNPSNDRLWQIKPVFHREYSYGDDGFTQSYTPPVSTLTPGSSGLYGVAVDHYGDVIAVDGDTDQIIRYWRNGTNRSDVSLSDILPDEITENHWPKDPDAYGYTPSSVSLDGKMDYWVTLYDTVSTVKFDGTTNLPIAYAVPPVVNFLADSRTTQPSSHWTIEPEYQMNIVNGRPGEYGESIINPSVVETCKNNDIVVTYTNPLCSFIARYDSNGNFLHKFEFPGEDRYFTGDLCVDVSDHVWAITEGTGLTYDGQPDDQVISMLYSFDESLSLRFVVSSLEGTDFQDMLKPAPPRHEEITIVVNMEQKYDFGRQEFYETAILIDGLGAETNPQITLYEGNTYHFENQYYNNGKHNLRFQYMLDENLTLPLSSDPFEFSKSGQVLTNGVSGIDSYRVSLTVDEFTPERFLYVDENYPNTIALVINVIPKPKIDSRQPDTFHYMNNASFLTPDVRNNIWVSWGNRFCSRYNTLKSSIDMTVAVGSAYDDPRYHPLSAATHDRRDNAGRQSVIEGISMDTANNLLVINNNDKIVYAMNSDQPTLSAYVKLTENQLPSEHFSWVEALSSDRQATRDDFMLYPDSYMTKEQIQVFLNNVTMSPGTSAEKMQAYLNYHNTMTLSGGDTMFRTTHGSPPPSGTRFESELCAIGDWTGFRWINKYDDRPVSSDETTGYVSVTGASEEFELIPQTGVGDVVKINEDVDFAGVLRSYMQQPSLVNSPRLYEELLSAVFGTTSSSVHSLGKKIYERIANYVNNCSDIDTCTVNALHGLAELVNYKLTGTGYTFPAEMQRLIDLLSISFSRLKGTTVTEELDFEKFGNWTQQVAGVNLGPELMFVLDWDPNHGYSTGDYVKYGKRYYECLNSPERNLKPSLSPEFWRWHPDGIIRAITPERALHVYNKMSSEKQSEYNGFDDFYAREIPIRLKLIQNLNLSVDQKIVLHEEHTGNYSLVQGRTIRLEDGRLYKLKLVDDEYLSVLTPNRSRPLSPEHVSTIEEYQPLYTQQDNGVITVIGTQQNRNMTIVLFRNRTYRFEVESIGHPIIITDAPGLSAEPSIHVADQNVEYGKIIIKTDDDPIRGPLPEKLYYQSVNDESISGTILIKDVDNTIGYSTQYDGLTSYALNLSVSSHEDLDRLGWGMSFPENGNAWQFYSVFEYVEPTPEQLTYRNNIIDWNSPQTTIDIDTTFDEWFEYQGVAHVMIEKTLRDGLGLLDGIESINNQ
jgi:hypothetical protein